MRALFDMYGAALIKDIGIHTLYVLMSLAIGFALGLVLGILLSRVPKWSGLILPVLSVFQTIPGLVFIGVLYIWWGGVYPTVMAAMIGLKGLGDFVYQGVASNNNTLILLGAIPAAILAIVFGAVIDLLQRKVTPRGLKKEVGK